MDIERTMAFILEQHARNEAALAELMAAQKERRVGRPQRTVRRLARVEVTARNQVNRTREDHEKWLQDMHTLMAEIGRKLNALIGNGDGVSGNPPQS